MVDRATLRKRIDAAAEKIPKDTEEGKELYQVLCGLHLILTPVPAEIEGGDKTYYFVCGECHGVIGSKDKFCNHCGYEISWVGF